MNNYLAGICDDLDNQFPDSEPLHPPTNYYINKVPLSHNYLITEEDIKSALKGIDSSKGSGIDYLPTFVIKDAFLSILPQITHLFNQSLITGVFPEEWAVARITPIPKGGDARKAGNWRPISILPLPGKFLEKICTKYLK